ncbi:MAG: hypothetical protein LBM76_03005 [Mycoplasmataceae bacterium]|jgi:hypothetical protein|nr:hypothetical protein [Mycoplasmataceae bacterium]
MSKVVGCEIIKCRKKPELNGLIIEKMKINSVNKVKKSGGKAKQPTLRELILALDTKLNMVIELNNLKTN